MKNGSSVKKHLRFLSAALAVLIFVQNAALVHAVENTIWGERRRHTAQQRKNNQKTKALVPSFFSEATARVDLASAKPLDPALTLPLTENALSDLGIASDLQFEKKSQAAQKWIPTWIQQAIAPHATIHNVSLTSNPDAQTILLFQDVHLHLEAQTNIAGALTSLANALETQENTPLFVALEGADQIQGRYTEYAQVPYRKELRQVAEALLKKGILSGPEFAVIGYQSPGSQAPVELPFHVSGVEKESQYQANVKALQDSLPHKDNAHAALTDLKRVLGDLKRNHYNGQIRLFDDKMSAYQDGTLTLPDYILYLDSLTPARSPALRNLIEAALLEGSIDFKKVDKERSAILQVLLERLSQSDVDRLFQTSALYRAKKISYAGYYSYLRRLAEKNGVGFQQFPEMNLYVQYVLKSDSLDASVLIQDMGELEKRAQEKVIRRPEHRDILTLTRDYHLLKKLVHHVLTEDDWLAMKARQNKLVNLKERLNRLGEPWPESLAAMEPHWSVFKDFYEIAVARNRTMAVNTATRLKADGTSFGVLVAGGFHSKGLARELKKQNLNVLTLSPHITKIDNELSAIQFLSNNRTPLDQLFQGNRLFLAMPQSSLGAAANQVRDLVLGLVNLIRRSVGSVVSIGGRLFRLTKKGGEKVTSSFPAEGTDSLVAADWTVEASESPVTPKTLVAFENNGGFELVVANILSRLAPGQSLETRFRAFVRLLTQDKQLLRDGPGRDVFKQAISRLRQGFRDLRGQSRKSVAEDSLEGRVVHLIATHVCPILGLSAQLSALAAGGSARTADHPAALARLFEASGWSLKTSPVRYEETLQKLVGALGLQAKQINLALATWTGEPQKGRPLLGTIVQTASDQYTLVVEQKLLDKIYGRLAGFEIFDQLPQDFENVLPRNRVLVGQEIALRLFAFHELAEHIVGVPHAVLGSLGYGPDATGNFFPTPLRNHYSLPMMSQNLKSMQRRFIGAKGRPPYDISSGLSVYIVAIASLGLALLVGIVSANIALVVFLGTTVVWATGTAVHYLFFVFIPSPNPTLRRPSPAPAAPQPSPQQGGPTTEPPIRLDDNQALDQEGLLAAYMNLELSGTKYDKLGQAHRTLLAVLKKSDTSKKWRIPGVENEQEARTWFLAIVSLYSGLSKRNKAFLLGLIDSLDYKESDGPFPTAEQKKKLADDKRRVYAILEKPFEADSGSQVGLYVNRVSKDPTFLFFLVLVFIRNRNNRTFVDSLFQGKGKRFDALFPGLNPNLQKPAVPGSDVSRLNLILEAALEQSILDFSGGSDKRKLPDEITVRDALSLSRSLIDIRDIKAKAQAVLGGRKYKHLLQSDRLFSVQQREAIARAQGPGDYFRIIGAILGRDIRLIKRPTPAGQARFDAAVNNFAYTLGELLSGQPDAVRKTFLGEARNNRSFSSALAETFGDRPDRMMELAKIITGIDQRPFEDPQILRIRRTGTEDEADRSEMSLGRFAGISLFLGITVFLPQFLLGLDLGSVVKWVAYAILVEEALHIIAGLSQGLITFRGVWTGQDVKFFHKGSLVHLNLSSAARPAQVAFNNIVGPLGFFATLFVGLILNNPLLESVGGGLVLVAIASFANRETKSVVRFVLQAMRSLRISFVEVLPDGTLALSPRVGWGRPAASDDPTVLDSTPRTQVERLEQWLGPIRDDLVQQNVPGTVVLNYGDVQAQWDLETGWIYGPNGLRLDDGAAQTLADGLEEFTAPFEGRDNVRFSTHDQHIASADPLESKELVFADISRDENLRDLIALVKRQKQGKIPLLARRFDLSQKLEQADNAGVNKQDLSLIRTALKDNRFLFLKNFVVSDSTVGDISEGVFELLSQLGLDRVDQFSGGLKILTRNPNIRIKRANLVRLAGRLIKGIDTLSVDLMIMGPLRLGVSDVDYKEKIMVLLISA